MKLIDNLGNELYEGDAVALNAGISIGQIVKITSGLALANGQPQEQMVIIQMAAQIPAQPNGLVSGVIKVVTPEEKVK